MPCHHILCRMFIVPYHHVLCRMSIVTCLVSVVRSAMLSCLCRQGGEEGEGETKECKVFWQRIRPKGRAAHSYTTQCTRAPHSALIHHTVHSYITQCTRTPHSVLIHHTVRLYATVLVTVHPYTSVIKVLRKNIK